MWLTLGLPLLQNVWKSCIQHRDTSLWIIHPLHINNGFSLFSSKLSCYKGFSDWNHCHTVVQYFQCDVLMQWYTSDTHSTIWQVTTREANWPLMWGWWVDEGSRSSYPCHITQSTWHWVSELWQINAVQEAWCLLCYLWIFAFSSLLPFKDVKRVRKQTTCFYSLLTQFSHKPLKHAESPCNGKVLTAWTAQPKHIKI